ncbi:uncharacterized protein LOC131219588 [Magnolia sinica]|uniref:uncharacterized protein LOC131219588 n=1 Tax=Magnolia sinica TaxID=86752 RepID=UPI002658367B|nr:uncharacterized protein LOC131219588 [Magnolia sinica]
MEGVGARLGRSSTRYGPATVFSGPVRKWKKTWVHVSSSHASSNHSNATANGHNASHLLLYKWTPISQSNNNNNTTTTTSSSAKDDDAAATATEEPPRRKFRYVPVSVVEEQQLEAASKDDDETKGDTSMIDPTQMASKSDDGADGKPDVNDAPMEEVQALDKDRDASQGPSETNLDLNLA